MASDDDAVTDPMLSLSALRQLVAAGAVDTVIVAFADMQGRLVGKRVAAQLFVDEVATRGAECCDYLLAVDVDMNTVDGYAMSSWDTGYGDTVLRPDLSTLRRIPWLPGTALVIADVGWADGSPVAVSPRAILRRQLDRLARRGWSADEDDALEVVGRQVSGGDVPDPGLQGRRDRRPAAPAAPRSWTRPGRMRGADVVATQLINPATEEVLRSVEHADAAAVDDAVGRARAAQRRWARLSPAERASGLRAFAAAVDAHLDELAALEVANSGHPIGSAEWEAGHVRDVLTYYSASPERLSGKQIPVSGGLDVTFNEPLGVVGVIAPWNFPMPIACWGFAPALAAGNAVLVKPAEATPLTTIRLGELAADAGLDPDLLQVLPGPGPVVGERFVTHPDIAKIVFTGSTEVGKRVLAVAAARVKRVTLELGGKSANIVFADCDLERAAATAPAGVFDNAGQDCCARSRILVQRSVYDRFMELLEPAVKGVVVGDPASRGTEMGPLVSAAHRARVASYVPDGAPVAFRGTAPSGRGFWFPPTVLTPQRTDRTVTEEIFGPVVTVLAFDDEQDAVTLANDTAYGLSGSIWTNDLSRALRVSRAVEAGNLSVNSHSSVRYNTPFGGFKQSGLGRELGPDAPLGFTETKNVFIAIGED